MLVAFLLLLILTYHTLSRFFPAPQNQTVFCLLLFVLGLIAYVWMGGIVCNGGVHWNG